MKKKVDPRRLLMAVSVFIILSFGLRKQSGDKAFGDSVVLTRLVPTFIVKSGDKDWNTKLILKVIHGNKDVATLGCCGSFKPDYNYCEKDHWCENQAIPNARRDQHLSEFTIIGSITKEELNDAEYQVGFQPVGSDDIVLDIMLVAHFSDGTQHQWKFADRAVRSIVGSQSFCRPVMKLSVL